MPNPASEDIKDFFQLNSSLGIDINDNLFIAKMPNAPNECIVLYDSGSMEPIPPEMFIYERVSLQVLIRGEKGKYKETFALANDVANYIVSNSGETINSTRYIGIWAKQSPFFLQYDELNRPIFSVNFNIHRTY